MIKVIAKNPVAMHNYNIINTIEAGIVLTGTEIKSIRSGKANLKDSYASIQNGEVYIHSMHISPYEHGNIFNKDPLRDRKLLLNKREINKLIGLTKQKGYSIIPISLYFKGSFVKVELGIGKGKKLYDKRQDLAKKNAERQIAIHLRRKRINKLSIYPQYKSSLNTAIYNYFWQDLTNLKFHCILGTWQKI